MTRRQTRLLGIVLSIQALLAVAGWRDLARRTEDQVRGRKQLWRAFILLNPGNSLLYWLFGRQGVPSGIGDGKAHRVDVPGYVLAADTGTARVIRAASRSM